MMLDYLIYTALALLVIIFLSQAIRILREYERGVVFTLGRFIGVKGPGLIILIPVVQQLVDWRCSSRGSAGEPPTTPLVGHSGVRISNAIQPETGAVPADHGIGTDNCKCLIHLRK
jgi:hypothetical protein